MASLVNHPGLWLNDMAAASLARYEADHGVIPITSAGRTVQEQQALIDRWNRGGVFNRPPYLYEPKRPAWAGSHVMNGGNAIDTPQWRSFLVKGADYGWVQTYSWDVVHFEYDQRKDKHRNRPEQTPEPEPELEEEEDMRPRQIHAKFGDGRTYRALVIPGTGYFVKWTEGGSTYANGIAAGFETGDSTALTQSLFEVFEREAMAMRPRDALSIELAVA